MADAPENTVVHLLRHGEVHNPDGILYGRRPGFHLSELGRRMAQRIADSIGDRDITHMRVSPLERARETGAPLAERRGLTPVVDDRVIESLNDFEGLSFADGAMTIIKRPRLWKQLYNPFKPSWGEPYDVMASRMMAAVRDARDAARDVAPMRPAEDAALLDTTALDAEAAFGEAMMLVQAKLGV